MHKCFICLCGENSEEVIPVEKSQLKIILMSNCGCNDYVHERCLQRWKLFHPERKNECPICRTKGINYTLTECVSPTYTRLCIHNSSTVSNSIIIQNNDHINSSETTNDTEIYIPLVETDLHHHRTTFTRPDDIMNHHRHNNINIHNRVCVNIFSFISCVAVLCLIIYHITKIP